MTDIRKIDKHLLNVFIKNAILSTAKLVPSQLHLADEEFDNFFKCDMIVAILGKGEYHIVDKIRYSSNFSASGKFALKLGFDKNYTDYGIISGYFNGYKWILHFEIDYSKYENFGVE